MTNVIQHMESQTVHRMRLQDPIIIILEENPTTGYVWEPKESQAFTYAEDTYLPQEENLLAGGRRKHQFVFLPVGIGSFTLTLNLQRPWDPNDIIDTVTFQIDIIE